MAYRNTDVLDVREIRIMPEPDEITQEEKANAENFLVALNLKDGTAKVMPFHFIISIEED
jgi:hypothetical protein